MGFWGVGVLPFWVIKIYICTSVSSVFRGGGGEQRRARPGYRGAPGTPLSDAAPLNPSGVLFTARR